MPFGFIIIFLPNLSLEIFHIRIEKLLNILKELKIAFSNYFSFFLFFIFYRFPQIDMSCSFTIYSVLTNLLLYSGAHARCRGSRNELAQTPFLRAQRLGGAKSPPASCELGAGAVPGSL